MADRSISDSGKPTTASLETVLEGLSGAVQARSNTHDYIREALRHGILTGQIPLGTRLNQSGIAAKFGASSTPVRDAMRDLQAQGLVRIDSQRGTTVVQLDDLELENVFEMRELIEPLALRDAIDNFDPDLLTDLQMLHNSMSDQPFSDRWVRLNREFHRLLLVPCRSIRLTESILELQDASVVFVSTVLDRFPHVRRHSIEDHGELIEACRTADYDRAHAAVLRHLDTPRQAFELIRDGAE